MNAFEIFAKLALDSSEYDKGLENSEEKAGKFGVALKKAFAVGGAAIAAAGTAAAGAVKAVVQGAGEVAAYGDNIDKMSQKMGLSAQAYQEWDAIMQHSGTSIESMQAGMKTLANAVENGNKAFERLGMSQDDIAKMSQEELFGATITALQNVENETERTYLAGQLLGRGATELGALLNTSAEDTEAMRQRVHELGGVLSDDAVKAAAKYQDSLQDMQTAFGGLKRGLMGEMMPSITTVMDGLTEIFSGNTDSGIAIVSQGIDTLVSDITDKMPQFIDLAFNIISALVDTLIENLPKLLEMGGQLIGKLIAGIIAKLPDLLKKAPEIIMAVVSGLAAAWPEIKKAGADLIRVLLEAITALWGKVKEKGSEIIDTIKEGVKKKIDDAKQWGKDLLSNFIQGIKDKIAALKETVSNVANTVKSFLGFSEPDEGPLSNFHTYAPDMMRLFAQGIRDNEKLITDQIKKSFDVEPVISASVEGGATRRGYAVQGAGGLDNQPIYITVQSVLDGRIIGETAYNYQRRRARAMGV